MSRPSPQLEALIASHSLDQILQDDRLIPIGMIALGEPLPGFPSKTNTPQTFELSEEQKLISLFASFGGTTEQVARIMDADEDDIEEVRDGFIDIYGVPTMAAVINQKILRRHMPLETEKDPRFRHLNRIGLSILNGIAKGDSNGDIGKRLGVRKPVLTRYLHNLFYHITANGRTHSIRRAYELGIDFSEAAIDTSPQLIEDSPSSRRPVIDRRRATRGQNPRANQ